VEEVLHAAFVTDEAEPLVDEQSGDRAVRHSRSFFEGNAGAACEPFRQSRQGVEVVSTGGGDR